MATSQRLLNSSAGTSLVSVLIAFALLSILAMGAASMYKRIFSAQHHSDLRGELSAIRRQIINNISCSATLNVDNNSNYVAGPPQACSGDIDLYRLDKNGHPKKFLAAGSKLGKWVIKASCDATKLTVLAARPSPTGGFFSDPLTGRLLDWDAPEGDLFGTASPCTSGASPRVVTVRAPVTLSTGYCNGYGITCGTAAQPARWWAGTATCPSGYAAVTGGAECNTGSRAWQAGQWASYSACGGYSVTIGPHPDDPQHTFQAGCCEFSYDTLSPGATVRDALYVVCVRDD